MGEKGGRRKALRRFGPPSYGSYLVVDDISHVFFKRGISIGFYVERGTCSRPQLGDLWTTSKPYLTGLHALFCDRILLRKCKFIPCGLPQFLNAGVVLLPTFNFL